MLARVVLPDGTFWEPARAIRWNATHVMVMWRPDATEPYEKILWLRNKEDATRRLAR